MKSPETFLTTIDTHAHLDKVTDIPGAIARAKASGVAAVVAAAMDLPSNKKILELSDQWPGYVIPALGIHPWSVNESEFDETLEFIVGHAADCAAIGEIGLDYKISIDAGLQRRVFGEMLKVAREFKKPALTHSRDSYEDVLRMVEESGVDKAVFHWYSGPIALAERIVGLGHYISATPAVQYSKAHRAVISAIPLENLLLETDCPVEYRGKTSEPADLEMTLNGVAELKGVDASLVAKITTSNAAALFGIDGVAS
jgi:TatD DNase family protein